MDFENLRTGQRYLFHYKGNSRMFRANFVHLFEHNNYKTLIVKKYESNNYGPHNPEIWYISLELVSHYETLCDIMKSSILPDDVLLEIDNFM